MKDDYLALLVIMLFLAFVISNASFSNSKYQLSMDGLFKEELSFEESFFPLGDYPNQSQNETVFYNIILPTFIDVPAINMPNVTITDEKAIQGKNSVKIEVDWNFEYPGGMVYLAFVYPLMEIGTPGKVVTLNLTGYTRTPAHNTDPVTPLTNYDFRVYVGVQDALEINEFTFLSTIHLINNWNYHNATIDYLLPYVQNPTSTMVYFGFGITGLSYIQTPITRNFYIDQLEMGVLSEKNFTTTTTPTSISDPTTTNNPTTASDPTTTLSTSSTNTTNQQNTNNKSNPSTNGFLVEIVFISITGLVLIVIKRRI
ncbi:MAG: hypothetical protein ACXAC7_13525 [Candidatus Hodarchaeales archaeon]|jgi:hypothetical protein